MFAFIRDVFETHQVMGNLAMRQQRIGKGVWLEGEPREVKVVLSWPEVRDQPGPMAPI